MGLEIKRRWYAVPPGQIYPIWYEPGDEVPDALADLAAELGLDQDEPGKSDVSKIAINAVSEAASTGGSSETPSAPKTDEEKQTEVTALEVRHIGAGRYAVFAGAERLTLEPMTKPDADAERERLLSAESAAGAGSAEGGPDAPADGESGSGSADGAAESGSEPVTSA